MLTKYTWYSTDSVIDSDVAEQRSHRYKVLSKYAYKSLGIAQRVVAEPEILQEVAFFKTLYGNLTTLSMVAYLLWQKVHEAIVKSLSVCNLTIHKVDMFSTNTAQNCRGCLVTK